MKGVSSYRPMIAALACFALAACGGGSGGSAANPVAVGGAPVSNAPPPTPSPTPAPSPPPATSVLPPAAFGSTASADFPLVGWQETSQGANLPSLIALAEQKGTLAWSASLMTYAIALTDLASGRLVYTFPSSGNNLSAFSIVQADGSIAKVYVTLRTKTGNVGEIYWQTADGVTPFVYAHALFGIPLGVGNLPTSGRRVFTTDTDPQSSIVFDFVSRKVSGTVTSFNDGGSWDPAGPKELATLEPADIQPDGSFVATIAIPGAPKKGELRGRLFGASGGELAVYWNAPVRNGYDKSFDDWRAVMTYAACGSCSG